MKSVIYKSVLLPAPAEKLFEMYLDSKAHSAFTGMPAEIDGSDFKAFNGMLNGNILQVVKPKLIVQSWRSIAFNEEDTDSTLIINFILMYPNMILRELKKAGIKDILSRGKNILKTKQNKFHIIL